MSTKTLPTFISSPASKTAETEGKKGLKQLKKSIFIVKIKCLPFGFFEEELLKYFSQFGKVLRVRVARSKKTGNHKGWAYVAFDDKDVAEIAAETMDGYLMFEKRLLCHVMKVVPKCMEGKGPVIAARPRRMGTARKAAKEAQKPRTEEQLIEQRERRASARSSQWEKLKQLGVDYDMSAAAFTATTKPEPEESKKSSTPAVKSTKKAAAAQVVEKVVSKAKQTPNVATKKAQPANVKVASKVPAKKTEAQTAKGNVTKRKTACCNKC